MLRKLPNLASAVRVILTAKTQLVRYKGWTLHRIRTARAAAEPVNKLLPTNSNNVLSTLLQVAVD